MHKRIALLSFVCFLMLVARVACGGTNSSPEPLLNLPSNVSKVPNEMGSMIDPRDGQVYKTATIGEQTWMAENLNYENDGSFCYDDRMSYCIKYGRLYTWDAAMKACPTGYHLPTLEEWNILLDSVGGVEHAGTKLKISTGWENGYINYEKGKDCCGFSALPAGRKNKDGSYIEKFKRTYFWSASEITSFMAYNISMKTSSAAHLYESSKISALSVRCLKGDVLPKNERSFFSYQTCAATKGGEFIMLNDSRDGKMYRAVRIGGQVWMAENLNYKSAESSCYKDSPDYCEKYGRIYSLSEAKNVCPAGYHLPSPDEWKVLFNTLGQFEAGTILKAKTGWINGGSGTDDYCFSAFPAGGSDGVEGEEARFWSNTDDSNIVLYMSLRNSSDMAYLNDGDRNSKLSVRCVRNGSIKNGDLLPPPENVQQPEIRIEDLKDVDFW